MLAKVRPDSRRSLPSDAASTMWHEIRFHRPLFSNLSNGVVCQQAPNQITHNNSNKNTARLQKAIAEMFLRIGFVGSADKGKDTSRHTFDPLSYWASRVRRDLGIASGAKASDLGGAAGLWNSAHRRSTLNY